MATWNIIKTLSLSPVQVQVWQDRCLAQSINLPADVEDEAVTEEEEEEEEASKTRVEVLAWSGRGEKLCFTSRGGRRLHIWTVDSKSINQRFSTCESSIFKSGSHGILEWFV